MYRDSVLVLFVLLATAATLDPPISSKHYRTDYVYNGDTDAFYKLHIQPKFWTSARDHCIAEGAGLMSPVAQEDIDQLHRMLKRFPDLGDLVWVADDGLPHDSAEETPIIELEEEMQSEPIRRRRCDVVTSRGEVETNLCYKQLPFMCKVAAKDAPFDSNCDVYGTGYTYSATVGSCYKTSRMAMTWEEGFNDCKAQGGHLVVVNSEAERLVVWQIMKDAPHVHGSARAWYFYVGFRTGRGSREFKTIFNQTLEEAGCAAWSPNEPNNGGNRGEDCGSIFTNDGKFNDITCYLRLACICEKEVPKITGT